jgi:hypothetical protein
MEDNGPLRTVGARLWNRLTEAAERFAVIAATPVPRTRRRVEPVAIAEGAVSEDGTPLDPFPPRKPRAPPKRPLRLLPRGYGWLARLAPDLVPYGIELAYFLAQPDMMELLASSPRLCRALRPLCRMFGLSPPHITPSAVDASDAPDAPDAPAPPPRRAPNPARVAAHRRRLSDAAAAREYGPQGYRPSTFDR